MKKQEVATLSFKIVSLYALIQSVEGFSYIGYYISASSQADAGNALVRISTMVLVSVLLAGVSWYLWFRANRLSITIFPIEGAEDIGSRSSPLDMQEVAYRVLGLYLLFLSLSRLSSVIVSIFARSRAYQTSVQIPPETWGSIATMIVQFALSVWLILGAPKLEELLKIIRPDDYEVDEEQKD
jgi:hypothetical protein